MLYLQVADKFVSYLETKLDQHREVDDLVKHLMRYSLEGTPHYFQNDIIGVSMNPLYCIVLT